MQSFTFWKIMHPSSQNHAFLYEITSYAHGFTLSVYLFLLILQIISGHVCLPLSNYPSKRINITGNYVQKDINHYAFMPFAHSCER